MTHSVQDMEARMELTLDANEAEVLKRVVSQALSDLPMEISDTDNYDMRQDLKRDEETLKSIIARLDSAPA